MTTERIDQTRETEPAGWWTQRWIEDMHFGEWLAEWRMEKSAAAAIGMLDAIFECQPGDGLAAAQFLFGLMNTKLPDWATKYTWRNIPAAPERMRRKAEDVFILQFVRAKCLATERELSRLGAALLVRDADGGGRIFPDLLAYVEKNRSGTLDNETKHYLSALRRFLLAVYRQGMVGEEFVRFCGLREANLAALYRAMLALGVGDAIERDDDASLAALEKTAFEPLGFPPRVPEDLGEAMLFGLGVNRAAAERLLVLQAVRKARLRDRKREEVKRRIESLERSLHGPAGGDGQPSVRLSAKERGRMLRELERLKVQTASWG